MKIGNKEYRIKEETYKDGHNVYIAQYAINFLFFKIWRDFIITSRNYYGNCVNFRCC